MKLVLNKLGPLSDFDFCNLPPEKVEFIKGMQEGVSHKKHENDHDQKWEDMSKLVGNCLQFNPFFRYSATECL